MQKILMSISIASSLPTPTKIFSDRTPQPLFDDKKKMEENEEEMRRK
jgi:hypothetical protein